MRIQADSERAPHLGRKRYSLSIILEELEGGRLEAVEREIIRFFRIPCARCGG